MSKQRPTPMNTRFTRKIEPGPGKPRVKLPGGLQSALSIAIFSSHQFFHGSYDRPRPEIHARHLEEVPEPKLCLERSTELVVDRIVLSARQPQLHKRAERRHHGSRKRVNSRSVDQVCTVINDVVKVKEVEHLRGKFNAFVFSEGKGLQQPQIDILEPAIAVCIALDGDARRSVWPIRGGSTVTGGYNAGDQKVSIAIKVLTRRRIDRKPASRADGARSGNATGQVHQAVASDQIPCIHTRHVVFRAKISRSLIVE